MSSDTCRSLKYPYVTVTLTVADPSGQLTDKTFEMTIPQFKVCNQCCLNQSRSCERAAFMCMVYVGVDNLLIQSYKDEVLNHLKH